MAMNHQRMQEVLVNTVQRVKAGLLFLNQHASAPTRCRSPFLEMAATPANLILWGSLLDGGLLSYSGMFTKHGLILHSCYFKSPLANRISLIVPRLQDHARANTGPPIVECSKLSSCQTLIVFG
nr:uncharacterized protein LOC109167367 isoform X1 [Ipomoea batatas]